MNETDLLLAAGGKPIAQGNGDIHWNFGVLPPSTTGPEFTPPTLYGAFPKMLGKWDGTSTVNHHEAVRRALGKDLEPHAQKRGTCGGHAGSRALELLQLILIAAGASATYHPVSHAWPYYLARREYGQASGNPADENSDGVPSGSIPPVLAKYGALTREAAKDLYWNGDHVDDVAALWGAGRVSDAAALEAQAKLNIVTSLVQVHSAQELADGIAAGGVGLCSDTQGYSLVRDNEGVCKAQGVWAHYQVRSGVRVLPSGRKVFDYNQSWGPELPSGPVLPGCPSNCFGVEWAVQDRLCRSGLVYVLFSFQLYDLQQGGVDIPWIF